VTPAALGLDGPTAVAIDEARLRLLRLYRLAAREAHPRIAANAQVALECWALRAAARRDRAAIEDCAERFFTAVLALEDWLLPIKAPDLFNRRLAREYLAYAHYKSAIEGDQIDARHFADKGLLAATAQPVEPEELARWFGIERAEARDLSLWRIRLEAVIDKHRSGPRAATAAVALARYDCWIERAAGRADSAHAAKCRGEFIDAMRLLEEGEPAAGERVAVRFDYDRLALSAGERAKIARVAHAALERNATISVAAVAAPLKHIAVEARHAWRRAETVVAALVDLGIPAERIRLLQRPALAAEATPGARHVDIVLE
jgi:OOP family OmpA-OmpF porin